MNQLVEPVSSMIVKYDITSAAIAELSKRYSSLEITDTKSYKVVLAAINDVRGYRITTENKRKELKKGALEYGRKVDSEAKRIAALLEPIETGLRNKKQVVDDKKAAIIAEKARIEEARIATIRKSISEIQQITIGLNGLDIETLESFLMRIEDETLVLDDYEEFKEEAAEAIANTSAIIKQAISARRKMDEEVEAQRIENIRLEEIRVAQEAEAKRLAEAQAAINAATLKIEKEKATIEAVRQAEVAKKEREALEKRLADEAKIKAEREAKEKAERDKKECEAKEYADLLEKERQENLKPDKKKLENWANKLLGIETVSLTADDAVSIAEEALDKIYEIADWVLAETSKL